MCINVIDDEYDVRNIKMMGRWDLFVVDVIIVNLLSFVYIYCVEVLGILLYLMFIFFYILM